MPVKVRPFKLHFEAVFLEHYTALQTKSRKTIDKAVQQTASNPRHPSLNTHKAKNIKAKYARGGTDVFIAYASKDLRTTFEYGPHPGMIAIRNCDHHDACESRM